MILGADVGGTFTDLVLVDGDALTTATMTFASTIDGAVDLTLDASATATDSSTITLTGAVGGVTALTSIDVDAGTQLDVGTIATTGAIDLTAVDIDLNGTSYASDDGNITLTGEVDLDFTGAVVIDSDANDDGTDGNILITGAVTDDADGDTALTLDGDVAGTGTITVTGAIGTGAIGLGSLTLLTTAQVDLGNVFTVGNINLTGATGNTDLNGTVYDSDDGNVTLGGAVD